MRGGTHALAGVLIGAAIANGASIEVAAGVVCAAAVGALIPDLDHPQAALSQRIGPAGLPFRLLGHRGVTHSGIAAALVLLIAGMVPSPYAMAAALGYCSHIILDGLTISGVPLFWPVSKRFRLAGIRTGSFSERLFAWSMVAGLVFMYRQPLLQLIR